MSNSVSLWIYLIVSIISSISSFIATSRPKISFVLSCIDSYKQEQRIRIHLTRFSVFRLRILISQSGTIIKSALFLYMDDSLHMQPHSL